MRRGRFWEVLGLGFLFSIALPAAYAARFGLVAPVYLFAGDSFYYLDLARRSAGFRGFTFDGQFATNGFHPLWEYLLYVAGRSGWVDYSQNAAAVMRVFWLDCVLLGLGAGLFAAAMTLYLRRQRLALLVVAPGLVWVLCALVAPAFGSTWSFVNGMESAPVLCFFGLALVLLGKGDQPFGATRLCLGSILLALAVMSRLDDIFLVAPALLLLVIRQPRRASIVVGPLVLLLGLYLAYNKWSVGVWLPVSGAAKASFALIQNCKWTLAAFLPVLTGDGPRVPDAPVWYYGFGERTARLLQMLLPAALAGVYLWRRCRSHGRAVSWTLLDALCLGVVGKALYNFCFVQVWDQGRWYYTVSIAVANAALVIWLDDAVERLGWEPSRRWMLAEVVWVLFAANIVISRINLDGPGADVQLMRDGQPLRQRLDALGAGRFVEMDDGFTSFVAQRPALAALGLALDPEGLREVKRGRLLALAYGRGYRILVAHGAYAGIVDDAIARGAWGRASGNRSGQPLALQPLPGDGTGDGMSFYAIVPVR